MAKIHPFIILNSSHEAPSSSTASTSSCSNKYMTSKRETFTIWMKSLVMQGNGCTAFDESGEIVYRIDNYDNKHSNEVYLMDLRGKLLFTVCEKKMCGFLSWEGYKSNAFVGANRPMFRVRKICRAILGNNECSYKVSMGSETSCSYKLEALGGKSSAFRITDGNGGFVAEAKRKQSSSGVVLGVLAKAMFPCFMGTLFPCFMGTLFPCFMETLFSCL